MKVSREDLTMQKFKEKNGIEVLSKRKIPIEVDTQIAALFTEATKASNLYNFSQALDYCDQILQLNPTNEKVLLEKSKYQIKLGSLFEAIETLSIVLAIANENLTARVQRARLLFKVGDYFAARVDYDNALRVSKESFLYIEQAENLIKIDQYETALNYLSLITENPYLNLDHNLKLRFMFTKAHCLAEIRKNRDSLDKALVF